MHTLRPRTLILLMGCAIVVVLLSLARPQFLANPQFLGAAIAGQILLVALARYRQAFFFSLWPRFSGLELTCR